MPLYEYECTRCGFSVERVYSIKEKPEYLVCANCGGSDTLRSIISKPQDIKPKWEEYIDENLGNKPILVKSRAHRKELMKKRNLEDQYHHKAGMPGQWV